MADIRIKDLTTLASASLTGDVFVIDGTTGTRKLSAFSPTFGGNATVTGTLTVSGTSATVGSGTGSITSTLNGAAGNYKLNIYQSGGSDRWYVGLAAGAESGSNGGAPYTITALTDAGAVIDNPLLITRAAGGSITTPRPVSISATTASTTTSTGALVVGNGTSGGLGVGGALNVGGQIRAQLGLFAGSPPTGLASAYQVDVDAGTSRDILSWGDSSRVGLIRGEQDGSGRATLKFGRYTASTFAEYLRITGLGATDAVLSVYGTTNSTSTSSGALVVSGGVGVAKRIHSGEGLTTGGDNETHISFVRNGTISIGPTSAATPKLAVGGGLQLSNTSQSIPAWGDVGAQLSIAGAVITDTTSSGTVSRFVSNSISASSIAASSPTTYTQAASLFIAAGPTANTNVTITNSYALFIAGGRINFGGLPTSSAGLQAGTLWNDGGTLKVA